MPLHLALNGFSFSCTFFSRLPSPWFWLKAYKSPCEWQLSVALLQSTSACQTDSPACCSTLLRFSQPSPKAFTRLFQFQGNFFFSSTRHLFCTCFFLRTYGQTPTHKRRVWLWGGVEMGVMPKWGGIAFQCAPVFFPAECKMQQMSLKTWHKNTFYAYATTRWHFSSPSLFDFMQPSKVSWPHSLFFSPALLILCYFS